MKLNPELTPLSSLALPRWAFWSIFKNLSYFVDVTHRTGPLETVLLLSVIYAKPRVVFSMGDTSTLKKTRLYRVCECVSPVPAAVRDTVRLF